MDKIEKALKKLTSKERKIIKDLLLKIQQNSLSDLDIKKLKGFKDIFRLRKGSIRILYKIPHDGSVFVLAIERRSEKTYRDF